MGIPIKLHPTPEQADFIKANGTNINLRDLSELYKVSTKTIRRWKIELGVNHGKRIKGKAKQPVETYSDYFDWNRAGRLDFIVLGDRK